MGFLLNIMYWLIGFLVFLGVVLFAISMLKALWDAITGKNVVLMFFPFGMIDGERVKKPKKEEPKRFIPPAKPKVAKPKKPRPMWLQILLMTPAEYMEYRRQKKLR